MRCSSSEALLDRYVDGGLNPRERSLVDRHVAGCRNCRATLEELRVIDALLLTPRTLEPAANFTFAAMAEVRALPAPAAPRLHVWPLVAGYLVVAWALCAAAFAFAGSDARSIVGVALAGAAQGANALGTIAHALFRSYGHGAGVPVFVAGVLALDITLALAFALVYAVVRPRLAAKLARVPEVR